MAGRWLDEVQIGEDEEVESVDEDDDDDDGVTEVDEDDDGGSSEVSSGHHRFDVADKSSDGVAHDGASDVSRRIHAEDQNGQAIVSAE